MKLTIELNDEQMRELAEQVAERIRKSPVSTNTPPMSVHEFRRAIGGKLSVSQIYRDAQAGRIRTVANTAKVLIPASELQRFL